MAVSAAVILLSLDLGFGTFAAPGPGFLPALAGSFMFLLSLTLFISSIMEGTREKLSWGRKGILRVVCILSALILYGIFLERIGFLIAAFLLMGSMLWIIGRQKIAVVILFALLSSFGTFALFHLWLNTPIPQGVLGF